MSSLLQPEERVLSTLNADGSRRWLTPRLSVGRFWRRRRAVAWGLISLFVALPYLSINDRPAVLLDIVHREFTLFGKTFLPTDTVLLALLVVGLFLAVFFATALFGRVWCGWACPQTVYLEFVFRPLERFFDGRPGAPRRPHPARRALKYPAYILLSAFLAHTFLAYFVGIEELVLWVQQSPLRHPVPFIVMVLTTALMLFDFAFFREQTCIVACPYGRLQSVLLDRNSLIVTYDRERGEPRTRARRPAAVALPVLAAASTPAPAAPAPRTGDCVDCDRCVTTCPTGIDIRQGLQMECIGCAQCIDACDDVMARLKRPAGLIRYSSQNAVEHARARILRPRVAIYGLILVGIAAAFITLLATASPADVRVLRGRGMPFTSVGASVTNTIQIKITNRSPHPAAYTISGVSPASARLTLDENPLAVAPGQLRTEAGLLTLDRAAFDSRGICDVTVRIDDGAGFTRDIRYRALGPSGTPPAAPRATP